MASCNPARPRQHSRPGNTCRTRALRRRLGRIGLSVLLAVAGIAQAQDGFFDPNWGEGGRRLVNISLGDDRPTTLLIDPGGRLVLAGHCNRNGTDFLCAARLQPDGQLDLSFGPNESGRILFGELPDFPPSLLGESGLALQPDGRIVLAGTANVPLGGILPTRVGMLVRLSASGHPEPGPAYRPVNFSIHQDINLRRNNVTAVAVAPDGKIVVVGSSNRAGTDPPNLDFGIARFNADLSPDLGFSGSGARLGTFDLGADFSDAAVDVALQPDGKIVVAGYARTEGGATAALLRLNADGSSDQGFGNGGRFWVDGLATLSFVLLKAVAIDGSGRIIGAGERRLGNTSDFVVVRITSQGQLDASFSGGIIAIPFDLGGPLTDSALDVAIQSDGKILVSGFASYTSGDFRFAVARLDPTGQLDATFGSGGKSVGTFAPPGQTTPANDRADAMALGNGGLMVAGSGRAQGLHTRFGIAKLRIDRVFVNGFQP